MPATKSALKKIKIATRASKLAQIQARLVGDALVAANPGLTYELVFVTTTGDKFKGDLAKVGGKVAFVKEIQQCLLSKKAHMAAHSLKDLPTDNVSGLEIGAVLPRGDIRDAVCCPKGLTMASLKQGSKVGTSSVRRKSQILATFPHLQVVPVRGNVDSRLAMLDKGEVDGLVLAKAGLERLGLEKRINTVLEPDIMCPSVSQGAICVETRTDDKTLKPLLESINHEPTEHCVKTERLFLDHLAGNCHTPIAGFVQITKNNNLRLIGLVASLDGKTILRTRHKLPYNDWQALAKTAADDLVNQGALSIIKATEQANSA